MGEALGVEGSFSGVLTAPTSTLPAPFHSTGWQVDGEAALGRRFGNLFLGGSVRAGMSGVRGTTGAALRLVEPLTLTVEGVWPYEAGGSIRLKLGEEWTLAAHGMAGLVSEAGVPRYQFGLSVLRAPVVRKLSAPVPVFELPPEPLVAEDHTVVPEAVAVAPVVEPMPEPAAQPDVAPVEVAMPVPEPVVEAPTPVVEQKVKAAIRKVRVDVYGGKARQAVAKAKRVCDMLIAQGIYGKDCEVGSVVPGKGQTRVELVIIEVEDR